VSIFLPWLFFSAGTQIEHQKQIARWILPRAAAKKLHGKLHEDQIAEVWFAEGWGRG
jgi:hypothetical protein